MATLGAPQTKKFQIGTAELRIGALNSAGRLMPASSVGLIDKASINVEQTSVDLKGGFPQVIVDTAITSQSASITATLREVSRHNLNIMMGNGFVAYNDANLTDLKTTLNTASAYATAATALTLTADLAFAAGDTVVIYPDNDLSQVQVALVASYTSGTKSLVLATGHGLLFPIGVGETVTIYRSPIVSVGAVQSTNYFSVMLIQAERATGRPIAFQAWKAALAGSANYDTNATDFASLELKINLLQPAAVEYDATTGVMKHLSGVIPSNPIGQWVVSSDAA
jgi:hypothetical protein